MVKITIVHPMDLWGEKVGGIRTFVKTFAKYAPKDFSMAFIGVTGNPKVQVGRWHSMTLEGRNLDFLPVLYVEDENSRSRVPLSLRFTIALSRYVSKLQDHKGIWNFHRIETSLPFGANVPSVLFIHGHMMDIYNPHSEVRWSRFPALYFMLEKRLISKFDQVYVVRSDGVSFYRQMYPSLAKNFRFLPTWVDDGIFYPADSGSRQSLRGKLATDLGFPPGEPLIIFVGRLEGQKDPLLLVEVFKELVSRRKEGRLLVVGTGSLEEEVKRRLQSHGILDRVHFTGVLSQPRLADCLRACDVFLMTSAFEGMPISVLEALACGLPVVSTDVGEVGRVVKNGLSGRLCSSRDPREICKTLEWVLNGRRIRPEGCVNAVRPYTARVGLKKIYEFHRRLSLECFGS